MLSAQLCTLAIYYTYLQDGGMLCEVKKLVSQYRCGSRRDQTEIRDRDGWTSRHGNLVGPLISVGTVYDGSYHVLFLQVCVYLSLCYIQ